MLVIMWLPYGAITITRQMPTASRGEPEIKNWTFGVVTHIIITLSNMKLCSDTP